MNNWDFTPTKPKQDPYEQIIPLLNPCSSADFCSMGPEKQDVIVEQIFQEVRKINIFPVFYFNEEGIKQEITKAIKRQVMIDGDVISIFYHEGLLLLDYLFPNLHSTDTAARNMIDRFYNDEKLKVCIKDYFKTRNIFNMRTVFFSTARYKWNTAINYTPMRAKAIYEKFCPEGGVVYDFCAGFGGRLLGALSSTKNFTYIGTDPNTETYNNLLKTGAYIEQVTGRSNSYKIYNECAEDLKLPAQSVDFVFSCPPFFALEKYSKEDTQSYIKYPHYEEWLEGFVRPTIQNCISAMKSNAIYCVDIENFVYKGKEYFLPLDWIKIAEEEGLILQKTYLVNTRSRKRDNWDNKIYIFTKSGVALADYTNPEELAAWRKRVQENEEKRKNQKKIIAEYDFYGNLITTYEYFDEIPDLTSSEIRKSSSKHKDIDGKYYKIYSINEEVLPRIESSILCILDDKYFSSYAEIGRYLGVSRQAVHQARHRNQKSINGHLIQWINID